jgi:hypothetical protein
MFQGGNGLKPDREEAVRYARIYNEWSAIQRAERTSQPSN